MPRTNELTKVITELKAEIGYLEATLARLLKAQAKLPTRKPRVVKPATSQSA